MTTNPTIKTITCQELHALCQRGPVEIVDVRSPEEFAWRRPAVDVRNLPIETFDPQQVLNSRTGPPDGAIYFLCEMGGRSDWACKLMIGAGYENVVNIEGGMMYWELSGLPLKRGA
jgi:rhodanese-related sulfurtransferase